VAGRGVGPHYDRIGRTYTATRATDHAAIAVFTLHHWTDWLAGCAELRRVARDRVVVLSWDPSYQRSADRGRAR
jgi:hypothetical protein